VVKAEGGSERPDPAYPAEAVATNPAERTRFLSEAAVALSSSLDREQIVADFMRVAVTRFCDGCIVTWRDASGKPERPRLMHRDPALERRAQERAQAISFDESNPVARIFEPVRALIVVPLLVANRVSGTIGFVSSDPDRAFDDGEVEIAEAVARNAAAALENAAAFERERELTERFRFLAQTTNPLFSSNDLWVNLDGLMQSVVGKWADWTVLYTLEPDGSVRADAVAYRDAAFAAVKALHGERVFLSAGERLFAEMVGWHRSVRRNDITRDALEAMRQPFLLRATEKLQPRSLVMIPLFTPDVDFGMLGIYLAHRNHTDADVEMFEELGRRTSLALEHSRSVNREVRLVQTLQEVILPSHLPTIPGAVLSSMYLPATSSDAPVGGDWYDAFELADGRYVLSIGDVTGRGLRASAIMGKLRHAINVIAMYEPDPARILDVAERVVLQRYPDTIVTAFVALYDPHEGRLRYANAGHPYPFLRRWDGSVEPLVADGMPIGLRTLSDPAQSRDRTLDDTALIAFYTDGVTEATRDIEYGERLLTEALAREAALCVRAPAALIAANCLAGGPHGDDAALLTIGFPQSSSWSFDAENAKAAWDTRGAFMEQLLREATADSDLGAAEIIFGELIGNVVSHAPGPIDITLEWKDDRGVLHVVDRGTGFEFAPPSRVDVFLESGRGLWLIGQFGSDLAVVRLPHFGTHVRVELPVRRRGAIRERAGSGVAQPA